MCFMFQHLKNTEGCNSKMLRLQRTFAKFSWLAFPAALPSEAYPRQRLYSTHPVSWSVRRNNIQNIPVSTSNTPTRFLLASFFCTRAISHQRDKVLPGQVPLQARSVYYQSGHRFREYQGWDGGGPTPSKFGLLVRPVLFTGAVLLGGLGLSVIYKDEQQRKQAWQWPGQQRKVAALDVMGWRFSVAQLVCGSLIAMNGIVFLTWTRSLRGTQSLEMAPAWLRKYFLHYAFSGRAVPLIGSAFSHVTFPHFLFNMMALWSFAPNLSRDLGTENFLAYYFSAAALTSLGGMLVKLATNCTTPSLGASGAVLWMAATTAFRYPDAQFGIIFLPFIALPAAQMILGVAALDCLGLVMGWKMFDHGAHLTAVFCGYVFVHGGYNLGVQFQREVLIKWRKFRKDVFR